MQTFGPQNHTKSSKSAGQASGGPRAPAVSNRGPQTKVTKVTKITTSRTWGASRIWVRRLKHNFPNFPTPGGTLTMTCKRPKRPRLPRACDKMWRRLEVEETWVTTCRGPVKNTERHRTTQTQKIMGCHNKRTLCCDSPNIVLEIEHYWESQPPKSILSSAICPEARHLDRAV